MSRQHDSYLRQCSRALIFSDRTKLLNQHIILIVCGVTHFALCYYIMSAFKSESVSWLRSVSVTRVYCDSQGTYTVSNNYSNKEDAHWGHSFEHAQLGLL